MASNLSILQWNINSYYSKTAMLHAHVRSKDIDIIMLQETVTGDIVRFSGYHPFVLPSQAGTRGLITLVKATIPCFRIENPIHCGDNVEVLAVEIHLAGGRLKLYNIYSRPDSRSLDISEVCASAAHDRVIIGGDFNAHHPAFSVSRKFNPAGYNVAAVLEACPEIALLNTKEPTHVGGGVLDLTFATATLSERIRWSIDETITSDHFGVSITLLDAGPVSLPQHNPRWKVDKANWQVFSDTITQWLQESDAPNQNVDALEARLVSAINQAASQAIPKTRPCTRNYKDAWYYNDEIKEVNHRVNMCRKAFRKTRSPGNLANLREATTQAREAAKRVREEKWLEWCESFGHQTTLSELWNRVKRATNRSAPRKTHHDPQSEAERLVLDFSARTSSANLPPDVRARQTELLPGRLALIRDKSAEPATSDAQFTLRELRRTYKNSSSSAPGSDGIVYPIISHLGLQGELALLQLINRSWETSTLPRSWKQADIVPIPKPKEPGRYRPISLLSCLGKTAERMVLNRLQWILGPPPELLHGFTKGMSTTHSIANLLLTISTYSSVVIFLDLEKAFELASPLAIMESLITKGIRGKLLAWISDYFHNRTARVRFQGHLSPFQPLENGTPQGGVLSPALFNTLMIGILRIQLPGGCKIISYADDLAIICTGPQVMNKAQRSLDLVSAECCRVGLRISAQKSKAMALRVKDINAQCLRIQGLDLEWVTVFQYLGVWIDQRLTFQRETQYLAERIKTRLRLMKAMTGKRIGAGHRVLRSFYVHAVRSVVDYASIALISAKPTYRKKLETIQNDATRIITGASMWTKVLNLRMECNLLPLDSRIDFMAAQFLAKVMQAPHDTYLRRRVESRLRLNYELFANKSWLSHTARVLISFELKEPLLTKGMDGSHPRYVPPAPWDPNNIEFSIMPMTGRKNQYPLPRLKAKAEEHMAAITPPGSSTYFTDGSVDPDTNVAGAGFTCGNVATPIRVPGKVSSLQAEAVAIMGALAHAYQKEGHVVIHTDSRAAIDSLQHSMPNDIIFLLTSVLYNAQVILAQGRRVILNWVPSHIGIEGNERADRIAELGKGLPITGPALYPSRQRLRQSTVAVGQRRVREQHIGAAARSTPCKWYRDTTGYDPLTLPRDTSREAEVLLHRLRLEYRCIWQVIPSVGMAERACEHCGEASATLDHYLQDCDHTSFLRQGPPTTSAGLVKRLCSNPNPWKLDNLVTKKPPR